MYWHHGSPRASALRLLTFSIIALVVTAIVGGRAPRAETPPVTVGGPFTLTAPDERTVTDADYHGRWLLVFFGYTSCPDLCPTTLSHIAAALGKLGPEAEKVQAIFITVDPERDTTAVMGQFTEAFDRRILGLTGTPQQIAAVLREYGAYGARRSAGATQEYLVDHSTYLYIMDPDGKFVRGFDFDASSDEIAGTLRNLMTRWED
jgi:protein SCO1